MTFKELNEVNKQIKTTDIKGKQYAEVNQRIKAFRMLYPEGKIMTKILSLENDMCICQAIISDEMGIVLGVGHAYECKDSSFINKTSYIENCETSAVGRALGMCGFGIDTEVASYEEVTNAITNQAAIKPITKSMITALRAKMQADNVSEDYVVVLYKLKKLEDMTVRQHNNAIENWDKIVNPTKDKV